MARHLYLFLILALLFIFTQCGPPSSNEPATTTKTLPATGTSGATPVVSLPVANQLAPATPLTTSSLTIGSQIPLDLDPQGLTAEGHDYGLTSSNISANISISEITPSTVKIDSLELIGVPGSQEEFEAERRDRKVSGFLVADGAVIKKMMPKAALTLLTSAQPTRKLGLQYEERAMGNGMIQQRYVLPSTAALEYSKIDLDGAKLEIFLGRHRCLYEYYVFWLDSNDRTNYHPEMVEQRKQDALDACRKGEENTRIWNDRIFTIRLKTQ